MPAPVFDEICNVTFRTFYCFIYHARISVLLPVTSIYIIYIKGPFIHTRRCLFLYPFCFEFIKGFP